MNFSLQQTKNFWCRKNSKNWFLRSSELFKRLLIERIIIQLKQNTNNQNQENGKVSKLPKHKPMESLWKVWRRILHKMWKRQKRSQGCFQHMSRLWKDKHIEVIKEPTKLCPINDFDVIFHWGKNSSIHSLFSFHLLPTIMNKTSFIQNIILHSN